MSENIFADALFQTAALTSDDRVTSLKRVLDDLTVAEQVLSEFRFVFNNPELTTEKQYKLLDTFEGYLSELTLEFLRILTQKRKLKLVPRIRKQFESLCNNEFGELKVKIRFPYEPDGEILEQLRVSLPRYGLYPQERSGDAVFEVSLDESVVAGFVAETGGKILDASLGRKLAKK
ncbi:MAG: F0F1 ATP synthase subunit delta [Oscillospiraceae bacterium]|nr:F0F1 ATP synthase subunit delta [Oscillospiraceae bacterium]